MIHNAFRCTLWGMNTNGGRPTPLCGPAAVLVAVHVKIEVFLRHFVVGAVFTHFAQRFIKRGFQLGVFLTQADTGAVAKVLLSLTDGPAKAKSSRQAVSGSLRWRRLHPAAPHPDGQLRGLNRSDPGSGKPPRQRPAAPAVVSIGFLSRTLQHADVRFQRLQRRLDRRPLAAIRRESAYSLSEKAILLALLGNREEEMMASIFFALREDQESKSLPTRYISP